MILIVSLPLASLVGGYAAGMYLVPAGASQAGEAATPETDPPQNGAEIHAAPGIPPAPVDPDGGADAVKAGKDGAQTETAQLLQIGRLTVPVLKPRSITYVVADIALALPEADLVAQVEESPETLMRMRDAVLASLSEAAASPAMAGPAIDTDALSARVLADLKAIGMPVDEVLFPNLFKQDVARQDIPQPQQQAAATPAPAERLTN
ncbi:hypothetical protein [Limimaricola litoreus]|nr:hypothetical protein [Limimaricola litoreus]